MVLIYFSLIAPVPAAEWLIGEVFNFQFVRGNFAYTTGKDFYLFQGQSSTESLLYQQPPHVQYILTNNTANKLQHTATQNTLNTVKPV